MRMPDRTHAARPDTRADEGYDRLQAEFGAGDPRAAGYLSAYSFFRERALVLEALGAVQGTVVDLGCGGGLGTLPLVRAGRRVIGIDFNAAACRQANRVGIEAVRGDAFSLPLADNVAETVVNVEFAQQYDSAAVECLLREAARVLRPAGRLVIVWPNRRALVHRFVSTALRILNRLRGRAWFPTALTHHQPLAMQTAGARAGLATERMFAIFPPLGLRFCRTNGPLVKLIGSSFIAVLRKPVVPQEASGPTRGMECP